VKLLKKLLIVVPVVAGLILVGILVPARQVTIEGIGTLSFETAVTLSVGSEAAYASPDWLSGWSYRRAVDLNPATSTADYQVLVTLTTGTMGNPYANVKSDGSDIRFTASDGTALQDYWVESWNSSGTSRIWVEVTASGTSTIYMYYGNAAAGSASDGDSTFVFFDDFSGDLSKWNIHIDTDVAITPSHGSPAPCLEISGGSTSGYPYGLAVIGSDATYNGFQDGIIEADIYPTANGLPEIIFRGNYPANTGYKGRWDTRSGNEPPWMKPPYAYWSEFGTAVTRFGIANQWQKAKLVINGSTFQIYSNDSLKSTVSDSQYSGAGEIGLANHYEAYSRFDNVRVRKYASPEPVATVGSEEYNSAPDPPGGLNPTKFDDGSWVDDDTPTLNFTQSDPEGDNVGYTIQIDDDDDFSSPAADYTSELLSEGDTSFTVGQAEGGGGYTAGGEGQALNDGAYFWRVMSTDEHGVAGGWSVANGGDIAFHLNTAAEAGGTLKNRYHASEDVKVSGNGFPINSDVAVYVVAEGEWSGGEAIADYGIVVTEAFTTDEYGNFGPEVIWHAPLEIGEYDVVFDTDGNGYYDEIPDFVNNPNHPGFTVLGTRVGGEVYPVDKAATWWLIGGITAAVAAAAVAIYLYRRRF